MWVARRQRVNNAGPTCRAVYKSWVCGRSLAEIVGANLAGRMDVFLFLSVVRFQVEVSPTS